MAVVEPGAAELSGGHIENVALTVSFLAADVDESIAMIHIVQTLRRKFRKIGKMYDLDAFGKYRANSSRVRVWSTLFDRVVESVAIPLS